MEGLIGKSSKVVGIAAGALLALTLMAGCGPNQDVEAAQAAATQADQAPRAPKRRASKHSRRQLRHKLPLARLSSRPQMQERRLIALRRSRRRLIPVAVACIITIVIGIITIMRPRQVPPLQWVILGRPAHLVIPALLRRLLPLLNHDSELAIAGKGASSRAPFFIPIILIFVINLHYSHSTESYPPEFPHNADSARSEKSHIFKFHTIFSKLAISVNARRNARDPSL